MIFLYLSFLIISWHSFLCIFDPISHSFRRQTQKEIFNIMLLTIRLMVQNSRWCFFCIVLYLQYQVSWRLPYLDVLDRTKRCENGLACHLGICFISLIHLLRFYFQWKVIRLLLNINLFTLLIGGLVFLN